ncbi:MAG: DEAD/DEAH box helicase [Candidatus Sumerlaeia bacterium]|nr:DEAD/DEAH box helicase [Candidatus Sumerlaeia bacterium]
MNEFARLGVAPSLLPFLERAGWTAPTPVQSQGLGHALAGRDLLVAAPTGTGKTGLYALPLLTILADAQVRVGRPKALITVPTRELAEQVAAVFETLSGVRPAELFGGVRYARQDLALAERRAIAVGTPGRTLDHIKRGSLKLEDLRHWVVDEADRLFDSGFMAELRTLAGHIPEARQTILLSATLPPEMATFARTLLRNPAEVRTGAAGVRPNIRELFHPVAPERKLDLLRHLLAAEDYRQALVFVRTRRTADRVAKALAGARGAVRVLHAGIDQPSRLAALGAFRTGEAAILVATDVAARGLDIPELAYVINYDVPNTPEDYVHRSGRTGRLERPGRASTLVTPRELAAASLIEDTLRQRVPVERIEEFAPQERGGPPPKRPAEELERLRALERPLDFDERPYHTGKAQSPFTRSGKLRREFVAEAEKETTPQRNKRRRAEKKVLNKKLPHQRRNKG